MQIFRVSWGLTIYLFYQYEDIELSKDKQLYLFVNNHLIEIAN